MANKIYCDRCGKEVSLANYIERDIIDSEHPDTDICQQCYLTILAASRCAAEDTLKKKAPGTTAKEWFNLYKKESN